jgi:hypothetical protein
VTRDAAKKELTETARALLAAIQAVERFRTLRPRASIEEAEHVRREAKRLNVEAMARFKTCCARLAIHAKGGV